MKFVKMHGLGNDFVFWKIKTEQIKIFPDLPERCVLLIRALAPMASS